MQSNDDIIDKIFSALAPMEKKAFACGFNGSAYTCESEAEIKAYQMGKDAAAKHGGYILYEPEVFNGFYPH